MGFQRDGETAQERVLRRELIINRWEKYTAIPLALLAIFFLGIWAVQVLVPISAVEWDILEGLNVFIWILFVLDFIYRFSYHYDKAHFLRTNMVELVALILPFFRFFRMFRVITALGFLTRVMQSQQGRIGFYIAVILPTLMFGGSLGVLEAEQFVPGATITNFGDAFWWAGVTLFTVGYGDFYPITFEGRIIGFVLMLSGWALLAVLAATVAAHFARQAALTATKKRR
ncbi:MAG: potassium channel family protein [Micrococcales bacterium]